MRHQSVEQTSPCPPPRWCPDSRPGRPLPQESEGLQEDGRRRQGVPLSFPACCFLFRQARHRVGGVAITTESDWSFGGIAISAETWPQTNTLARLGFCPSAPSLPFCVKWPATAATRWSEALWVLTWRCSEITYSLLGGGEHLCVHCSRLSRD